MKAYFDNNATTPIDPRVAEAIIAAMQLPGNPSSIHSVGREARQALIRARQTVANHFSVSPQEIIFTSGGTESANLLIKGHPNQGHIISTDVEHSCVYNILKDCHNATLIKVGDYGAPTPRSVEAAIRPDTTLIVLMAVNNETGAKTDIQAIAEIAQKRGITLIVDAVAQLGKEPLQMHPGISSMFFSAHKIHGPKGVGCLILKRGTKIIPQIIGGAHESNLRAGTENLPGIIGFAKALEILESSHIQHMQKLRDYFEGEIRKHFPQSKINASAPRVCNTSNISFTGLDGESLLFALDMRGIAVSHGSACSSGALEPSRILLNMGIDQAAARSSIRFSFSRNNTEAEIDYLIAQLLKQART